MMEASQPPPPADWLISMVKADLARIVHDTHGGFSHEEASQLVDLILDKIKSTLLSGESVKLAGFGSFRVVTRKPRLGHNPQTKAPIQLGPRKQVTFRPSRLLDF